MLMASAAITPDGISQSRARARHVILTSKLDVREVIAWPVYSVSGCGVFDNRRVAADARRFGDCTFRVRWVLGGYRT